MLDFRNVLLNETVSAAVNQQFFTAPPTPAAMPVQQIPYTAQQPYSMPPQQPYPAPPQQTENVTKLGDAAKQLGSAAVQLGGGVAKQLGNTAKQLGGSAAKHMSNAAKQLSEAAERRKAEEAAKREAAKNEAVPQSVPEAQRDVPLQNNSEIPHTAQNADAPLFRASLEEVKEEMGNIPLVRRENKKVNSKLLAVLAAVVLIAGLSMALNKDGKNNSVASSKNNYKNTYTTTAKSETTTKSKTTTKSETSAATTSKAAETTEKSSGVVWVTKQLYSKGYFTGEWENDKPNGFGVYFYENDSDKPNCYFGNWVNGDADGDFIYLSTEGNNTKYYQPQTYNMGKIVRSNSDIFYRIWYSDDFRLCSSYGTFSENGKFTDGFFYDFKPKVPSYMYQLLENGEVYNEDSITNTGDFLNYKDGRYVGKSKNGVPCDFGIVSFYNVLTDSYSGYLIDKVNEKDEECLIYFSESNGVKRFLVGDVEWDVGLNGYGISFNLNENEEFTLTEGKFSNAKFNDGKVISLDKNGFPMAYKIYQNGKIVEEYEF